MALIVVYATWGDFQRVAVPIAVSRVEGEWPQKTVLQVKTVGGDDWRKDGLAQTLEEAAQRHVEMVLGLQVKKVKQVTHL